jgi:hypothetical protein
MVKKLIVLTALAFGIGVASSAPAPAIDFICSCKLCTSSTSGLACRDLDHTGGTRFTSCGAYHTQYCS